MTATEVSAIESSADDNDRDVILEDLLLITTEMSAIESFADRSAVGSLSNYTMTKLCTTRSACELAHFIFQLTKHLPADNIDIFALYNLLPLFGVIMIVLDYSNI